MSHTDRSAALLQVEHTSYSAGGGAVLSALWCHTDRSAALLRVEHTSYSAGGGAVLGGSIASSSPDLAPPKKILITKMVKNCLTV